MARVVQTKPSIKIIGMHTLRLMITACSHSHALVGICFGHQIVARAMGEQVTRNDKWEVGPTPVSLTHLGKAIFGVDSFVWLPSHVPIHKYSHTQL
jgi:GMP synthase-like glutamine amidotransferase